MNKMRFASFILTSLTLFIFWIAIYRHTQAAPNATTYYVCDCQPGADGDCVAGNDANTGTNPATPWQTYEQARSFYNSSINAGDEIRFCQGGAHNMSGNLDNVWITAACTAAQPCIIADYTPPWASGDEARPILQRNNDGHGFTIRDSGHIFQNLDLRCSGCLGGSGWGFFLVEDGDDIMIDNVRMDGFAIGIHLRGCTAVWCTNDRVTVQNSQFTNNSSQGFLGHGQDLLIENNYFANNGDGTVFSHNIYLAGDKGVTIRNNELYRASLDGSSSCNGVSLVGHGSISDLLIEGNYIHEDVGKANQTCWGIAISPAYSDTDEAYNNLIIRGNRVENMGNVSIATSSCIDCTIENNVVVQQQSFGTTGIAVRPYGTGGDATSSNLLVRNNSMVTTGGVGIELNEGSGHTIVSNAIKMTQNNSNWDCFDLPLGSSSYDVVDYNVCGFSAGDWVNGVGSLAAWQAQGFGAHSVVDMPGFLTDTDLRAATETAVIVNAGHPTLSSLTDFNGNGRDPLPDVGAYEWLGAWEEVFLPFIMR